MRTFRKAAMNIVAWLSLAGAVHGQNRENTIATPTTKNLIDNLQETEDTILYATIGEMNQKYGNPEISQERKTSRNRYYGRFSNKNNTIYINPECKKNELLAIEIRLSELSHSKQLKEGKLTGKRIMHDQMKRILTGFNGRRLYETEWTIEYEAHKTISPKLIREFIECYAEKIDTNSTKDTEKLEKMMEYFDYDRSNSTSRNIQYITNTSIKNIEDIRQETEKNLEEAKKIIEKNKMILDKTDISWKP